MFTSDSETKIGHPFSESHPRLFFRTKLLTITPCQNIVYALDLISYRKVFEVLTKRIMWNIIPSRTERDKYESYEESKRYAKPKNNLCEARYAKAKAHKSELKQRVWPVEQMYGDGTVWSSIRWLVFEDKAWLLSTSRINRSSYLEFFPSSWPARERTKLTTILHVPSCYPPPPN
jgi:hypothetical protein